MAVVGEQLLQPDTGWQRINNNDSHINYTNSNLFYTAASSAFNEDMHYSWSIPSPSKVVFKFFGSKLRLICLNSNEQPDYSQNYINIDGVDEEIYRVKQGGRYILAYEKMNLDMASHVVTINLTQGTTFALDAIDIDTDGYMETCPPQVGDVLLEPESGWKRYDDSDTKFIFGAGFSASTSQSTYNKTFHQCQTSSGSITTDGEITFAFTGTKFRIIGTTYSEYSNNVQVTVDGVVHGTMNCTNTGSSGVWQALMYEATGLTNTTHRVKLKMINKTALGYLFDALDIDDTGNLIEYTACVGEQLTQPESGWKRIDDTDSHIKYGGTGWVTSTNQYLYKGTEHATNKSGDTITFKFYGSKLRVLSGKFNNNPDGINISIDGVSYKYNQSGDDNYLAQVILFEKLNLDLGKHTVVITSPSDTLYTALDAIDIDDIGYMIVSAGDTLTQPEPGWNRFDDRDNRILKLAPTSGQYSGAITDATSYNTTAYQLLGGEFKFKFFGTGVRILGLYSSWDNYTANVDVYIDDIKVGSYSQKASVVKYQVIYFEADVAEGPHTLRMVNTDAARYFTLDCVDINGNGYLTEPDIALGEYLPEPAYSWKRIDDVAVSSGALASTGTWLTQSNNKFYTGTVLYSNDVTATKTIYIACSKFRLISRKDTDRSTNCVIKIDNIEYPLNLNSATNTEPYMAMLFEKRFDDGNKVHKIEFISGTDNTMFFLIDAIDINEDGHILTQDEYDEMQSGNFLIKTASGYKTISSGSLVDVTSDANVALEELNKDYAQNVCFHKVAELTSNIITSLGTTHWSLVSNKEFKTINNAIKSDKELIVSNGDFSTKLADNIDYFKGIYIAGSGCSIKCVVSTDSGVTWKTTNDLGVTWTTLTNTTPLGLYPDLLSEEQTNWNSFRDEIVINGIDISILETINFNTLQATKLRFAYVLITPNATARNSMTKLDWQFDSQGQYEQLDKADLCIYVTNENISIKPLKDMELLKINVGVSSNKTKEQDLSGLLDKATFLGNEPDSVKKADKAKALDITDDINGTIKYYGTANNDPEIKMRNFPAGTVNDHIDSYDFTNLIKGVPQTIDFVKEIPNINCIPSVLKYVDGQTNVEAVLEKYTKTNIIAKTDNLNETESGLSIADTFTFNVSLNADGFYESEEINTEDYILISGLEV